MLLLIYSFFRYICTRFHYLLSLDNDVLETSKRRAMYYNILSQNFIVKRKGLLKIDQSVKIPRHRLSMGVASSCSSAPGVASTSLSSTPCTNVSHPFLTTLRGK